MGHWEDRIFLATIFSIIFKIFISGFFLGLLSGFLPFLGAYISSLQEIFGSGMNNSDAEPRPFCTLRF